MVLLMILLTLLLVLVLCNGRIDDTFNRIENASLSAERDGNSGTPDFFFPGDSFSVSFSQAVTAVGIFFNANLTPSTSDLFVQTSVGTATTGGSTYDFGTLFFAGLISDTPFTNATFGSVIGGSSFNVDNLTYAPVPEPLTMLGAGTALGFGAFFKKKLAKGQKATKKLG